MIHTFNVFMDPSDPGNSGIVPQRVCLEGKPICSSLSNACYLFSHRLLRTEGEILDLWLDERPGSSSL